MKFKSKGPMNEQICQTKLRKIMDKPMTQFSSFLLLTRINNNKLQIARSNKTTSHFTSSVRIPVQAYTVH
jgi:hydroxyacyl-ACP dehydratase HTD2-like protein with hotdog domain